MSREVRRVPVGWQHPSEYNPHWEFQAQPFLGKTKAKSRLLAHDQRFVGLMGDYPAALDYWQHEVAEMRARTGHGWTFAVEYHLTGFKGHDDTEAVVHPFYVGDTQITVRDEDHLYELQVAQVESEKPNPSSYMPVFADSPESLGWCLYETVSEGCPTTPVFATAAELIDHLCIVGEDYHQEPYRREAAERLVGDGFSMGSMVVIAGKILDSSREADRVAEATS